MKLLKFVTLEELFGKKPRMISRWHTADCMMSLGFCICNFLTTMLCFWMTKCIAAAFVLFLVIYCGKRMYRLDTPTPKALHILAVILRSIFYPAAILLTFIPFSLQNNWTWYYPVQRLAYTTERSELADILLPESLPEKTDGYDISLTPAGIRLTYLTDSETIAAYREHALSQDAEMLSATDEKASKWLDAVKDYGSDAELYVFPQSSDRAVYILNERTGYFELQYY